MSAILAVAQTVVATPVATPIVQVVHDTITKVVTVPALSPQLVTGLMLAGLALAGYLASVLHQIFESLSKKPSGWARGFNIALQVVAGLAVSAVASYIAGTLALSWASLEDFLGQFLIVMGTSQTRYAFFKWVNSLGTSTSVADPIETTTTADVEVPRKAAV